MTGRRVSVGRAWRAALLIVAVTAVAACARGEPADAPNRAAELDASLKADWAKMDQAEANILGPPRKVEEETGGTGDRAAASQPESGAP